MADLQANLIRLSERKLTEKVIIPLCRRLGFDSVRYLGGSSEHGIDVLCVKFDELEEREVVGIQVKRLKFTGNVRRAGHLNGLINQLQQILSEEVLHNDGTKCRVDRAWFISPYTVGTEALHSAFGRLEGAATRQLRIIDGPKLLQLIERKAPELLRVIGDPFATYRERFIDEVARHQEASAFQLRERRALANFFVELAARPLAGHLAALLDSDTMHRIAGQIEHSELIDDEVVESFVNRRQRYVGLPLNNVRAIEKLLGRLKVVGVDSEVVSIVIDEGEDADKTATVVVDETLLYEQLRAKLRLMIKPFTQARRVRRRAAALSNLSRFISSVEAIVEEPGGSLLFRSLRRVPHLETQKTPSFGVDIDEVLLSRSNLQITGPAGAGKTTLLRMLGAREAQHATGRLPVVVPLTLMTGSSTIESMVYQSAARLEPGLARKSFDKVLNEEGMLLLFDGLDEARTRDPRTRILEFAERRPDVQIVISSRPWAAMGPSAGFLTLELQPLSRERVREFFSRWFEGKEQALDGLVRHLDDNPHLYEVVSSPLVATVFAVVHERGGTLPSSLVESFNERLRLLLHDWDKSKDLERDEFSPKDKRFFLRKLAVALHRDGRRSMPLPAIEQLAMRKLGAIRGRTMAERFVGELIKHNNVLFCESDGSWGLGHLQFQEFLVAVEALEDRHFNLAPFMGDGWWSETIKMYCQIATDATSLVVDCNNGGTLEEHADFLLELIALAPNTTSQARGQVEAIRDMPEVVARSFREYDDEEIVRGRGRPR